MYKNRKVNAIISAAGSGTRFGGTVPKQFINIGPETVLETAVRRFDEHPWVDSIIVVASEEYLEETRALMEKFPKVDQVVTGGKERQDSIRNGLEALVAADGNEIALVHDAARPFVTREIIDRVTEKAALSGAAIPVVAVKDTIRQSKPSGDDEHGSDRAGQNDTGNVSSVTLDRSRLHIVQTPQGFRMDILREAYRRAEADGYYGTDDAGLVDRISSETGTVAAAVKVGMVEGDYRNIKITTPEDLPGTGSKASSFAGDTGNSAAESGTRDITALIGRIRTGTGFDVHQLVEGRKCILGGVDIPYEKGLLGHSDADVLIHAVMDALLGAAGLGDIGRHFPDTDERYKGISSILLLKHVTALLNENGFAVGNIDATVICQKPKIAPHIEQMKRNMADAMNIDPQMINIKGTTTEHLGFTGRGEGIASEAVCTIFHR